MQTQGRRVATRFVTLLALPNQHSVDRLGLIASRKFGNAVMRNRAKRRLREIFRQTEPDTIGARGLPAIDVVAIPRRAMLDAPFDLVAADVRAALDGLRKGLTH
ncbi:MAG: ribonuclease P protein component [Acidobacteria bacterium]|nr:ribonuclease P protein component [Acidobacteriota bacterium]